jgi:hypothetical protein
MIAAAFIVQAILLVKATWLYREAINPDAISYLRIAGYYMHWQPDLMVSGVWGPLLSWLMIPWLLVFDDTLLAAHGAMACSAVVFLFGTYKLLRAMKIPDSAVIIGTWITAFLSAAWTTIVISPDLLMSGIFCWGVSRLFASMTPLGGLRTGMIFGAAYLAKPVALPVSVMVIVALAVITERQSDA